MDTCLKQHPRKPVYGFIRILLWQVGTAAQQVERPPLRKSAAHNTARFQSWFLFSLSSSLLTYFAADGSFSAWVPSTCGSPGLRTEFWSLNFILTQTNLAVAIRKHCCVFLCVCLCVWVTVPFRLTQTLKRYPFDS